MLAFLGAIGVLFGHDSALANPAVTSSNGVVAANSTTLTIAGSGFDPVAANNSIAFNNGAVGTVATATTTQLSVSLSASPGTGFLTAVVTTDGQSSGMPVTVAVVVPSVQFSATSESVNAATGTFSIPVTVAGNPSFASGATGTVSTLGTVGLFYGSGGLAIDGAGNLYIGDYSGYSFGVDQNLPAVVEMSPSGTATNLNYNLGVGGQINGVAFDAAGNLYTSCTSYGNVSKITPTGSISTVAYWLNTPAGMAFDAAGNLYVANNSGNTVSIVNPNNLGGSQGTTFASGFNLPWSLAFDAAGNLYVGNCDQNNQGIVSKVTPGGAVSTFVTGLSGAPRGLAFDSAGNLYITDTQNNVGIIRQVTPSGTMSICASGFKSPNGLVFDATGNLYVLGVNQNYNPIVSKVVPSVTVPFTLSGTAVAGNDYTGVAGSITIPFGQATANIAGTVVPDPGANQTLTFTLGTPMGGLLGTPIANTLTIVEPTASVTTSTAALPINAPSIVIQGSFNPVVANNQVTFNDGAVGTVTSATATALTVAFTVPPTAAGSLTATVLTNGTSTDSPVQVATIVPAVTATTTDVALGATTITISGLGFDPNAANNSVIFNNGVIGTVTAATTTQLTVSLSAPLATVGPLTAIVTTDGWSSGAAVAVDTVVSIVQFSVGSESVNATDGTFSIPVTITGNPTFANGASPNVANVGEANDPASLAFDSAGNLYIADGLFNQVTKTVPGGTSNTFASGFTTVAGLACDTAGNLYVADSGANTVSVVTPGGVVSTFASGFSSPTKLVFDSAGNLYVANAGNGTVSKVTAGGVVSTFASGLSAPKGLTFDRAGNLYVANSGNGTVSEVTPGGVTSTFASGLNGPNGLAFDTAGNLFVSYLSTNGIIYRSSSVRPNSIIIIGNGPQPNGGISEVTSGGTVSSFATGLYNPTDLVSDAAGNLYLANVDLGTDEYGGHIGLVTEYSPAVTLPFTVGGTAVNGVDYSQISSSSGYNSYTLTFIAGHSTLSITGTLFPNAGATPAPTLNLTLGTPSGAVLGNPSTNTLTIVEPLPGITPSTAALSINASSIVLQGNFSPTAVNNTVTFSDGAVGAVTSATSNSLTVTFSTPPQSLGALLASVTSNGVSSGGPVTIATVVPGVTAAASTVALNVTTLTINGFGFDPNAANDSVVLSNGLVGTVAFATATQLTVNLTSLPANTGNIYATVTVDGFTSAAPVAVGTVEPTVLFSVGSETINAATGTLSIPVTLTGNPTFDSGSPAAAATIASGYTLGYIYPSALAFDAAGNLYFANSHTGIVTRITPAGATTVFASGFTYPYALAFDKGGNLFLADIATGIISKITPGGTVSPYLSGFNSLQSLAFDAAGNLYIASEDANYDGLITKVTPSGASSVFASFLYTPTTGLVFDAAGNLYTISVDGGPMYRIAPNGTVSTFASVDNPGGTAIDGAGNIYVSGYYDNAIYKITPGGVLSTLVSGISQPQGLAFDATGDLFVIDEANNSGSIQELVPTALVPFTMSGTAVAGTDYSGVTASPLVFVKGQATVNLTGTLTPDPGTTPALTITLGTPSGAILGSPTVNTLTIAEPLPAVTPNTASLAITATSIVLNGIFSPVAANNTVTFSDGAKGTVSSATSTSLTVNLTHSPTGLGALKATVTSNGVSSGAPIQVATIVTDPASLSALAVSKGTLSPVFNSTTTSYAVTVSAATTLLTLTPTASTGSNAAVTVNGLAVTSGSASGPISLSPGANVIPIVVTAAGVVTTYTVTVTRVTTPVVTTLAQTNLTATSAALNAAVNANGASTTASFNYGPTASYGSTIAATPATVTGLNTTTVSAILMGLKPLTNYHYQAQGVSTAGTGTGGDMTFTTPNNVPTLSGLLLSSGPLTPVFKTTTTAYTATVSNPTATVTLTPTVTDPNATVTVNGVTTLSGSASTPINLNAGPNPIPVVVTAQDGITKKTYTVNVTRTALLATMTTTAATSVGTTTVTLNGTVVANNGNTTLSFDFGTSTSYGKTITATPSTANGTTSTNFFATPVGLTPGTTYHFRAKGVNVAGTAKGADMTFTTISNVAKLSGLKLSAGTLSPAFSSGTETYAATVPNSTTSMTVTPTVPIDSHATVTVDRTNVGSGSPSTPLTLAPGLNTIRIFVTAQDGMTMTSYTVKVTRTTPRPVVVTQSATSVASTSAILNGTVNASGTSTNVTFYYGLTTSYSSYYQVPPVTGSTVTPVSTTVSGLLPANTYHYRISGTNAGGTSNGADMTFTTLNDVATLSNLVLGTGAMDQTFSPATTSYTQTVSSSTTSLTVTPTVTANSHATVTVNGTAVVSGSKSAALALSTGSNVINVVVTAQNGTTTNTYTITVTVPVVVAAVPAESQPAAPLAAEALVPIKAQLIGPVANGGVLPGATVTFAWNAGRSVSAYSLSVGRTEGGTDLYNGVQGLALSHTLTLPTDGANLYVTLSSMINGAWLANNYLFNAADTTVKAVLLTPADQSVLVAATPTFTWGTVPGAKAYWLSIGSTEDGTDLYDASQGLALTQNVTLPTDGRELFVTLQTSLDGQWVASKSTLTAAGAGAPVTAQFTSPADQSVLPGGTATFTWDAGVGVSEYWLSLGTSPAATNLYNASQGSHQTVTIAVPTDGSPLYLTLSSLINGQWHSSQYLLQAALPP